VDHQGLWLGVEIAAPMALVVAVDQRGEVVDTRRVLQTPTPESVAAACQVLAARWSRPVRGLGLCAENHEPWSGLTKALGGRFLGPGTARALAEVRKGALRGASDALVVHIGWTLQAGVLRAGQPLGQNSPGQEPLEPALAHLPVEAGGEICLCGARGCLQTWLGEAAWLHRAAAARLQVGQHRLQLHQPPVQTALLEGAELGDLATAQLLAFPLDMLARATALLASAFSAGDVAVQWPLSDPPQRLQRQLEARLRQLQPRLGRVVAGQHTALGAAWGAALWALESPE
jgi:predicted NBD/HSP70 family sugar kinase